MITIPIFDGHNDSLVHVYLPERGRGRSFFEESERGQLDLPRAMRGGMRGGFFAVFTPSPNASSEYGASYDAHRDGKSYDEPFDGAIEYPYALEFTHAVFDFAHQLEKDSQGRMKIIRHFSELTWCFENDVLGVVLHIEGGAAIGNDLENLKRFYDKGLRSLGPLWSRPNVFGFGVPFRFPHSPYTGPGLTEKGKELIQACNSLGIIVDLAHMNELSFWDVVRISRHPLVVSHAAAHALCPSTRNLTDEQLTAIAGSNGVVGVIFEPSSTRSDGTPNDESGLVEIVRHIRYLTNAIGIDHVAFGSDFDGAPMPDDLKDASAFPRLTAALRQSGYREEDLAKLAHRNWLRVIEDTWSS